MVEQQDGGGDEGVVVPRARLELAQVARVHQRERRRVLERVEVALRELDQLGRPVGGRATHLVEVAVALLELARLISSRLRARLGRAPARSRPPLGRPLPPGPPILSLGESPPGKGRVWAGEGGRGSGEEG